MIFPITCFFLPDKLHCFRAAVNMVIDAGKGRGYYCPMNRKNTSDKPIVLVALGGHAFMQRGEKGTIQDHEKNATAICRHLMTLVERDFNIIIAHGNGPQVGNLLLMNETCDNSVPLMPLDVLVAYTEGSLGYILQQAMLNELRKRRIKRYVVTVVSQVIVNRDDPAFSKPTKPVGPFLDEEDARKREKDLGWQVVEDAGRGWRRLVPSPRPGKIVQRHMIRDAAAEGHIVIAAGGGGIPVIVKEDGDYEGIEAVIDKDLTSAILATQTGTEIFIILTEVPYIYTGYRTGKQKAITAITSGELRELHRKGEFPAGSMGPKVEAICDFLDRGGKRAIVTNPETLDAALKGTGGTHVIGACWGMD